MDRLALLEDAERARVQGVAMSVPTCPGYGASLVGSRADAKPARCDGMRASRRGAPPGRGFRATTKRRAARRRRAAHAAFSCVAPVNTSEFEAGAEHEGEHEPRLAAVTEERRGARHARRRQKVRGDQCGARAVGETQYKHSKHDSIVARSAETEQVGTEDIEGSDQRENRTDSDPEHADWDPCSQGCGAEPMDQGLSGCLNAVSLARLAVASRRHRALVDNLCGVGGSDNDNSSGRDGDLARSPRRSLLPHLRGCGALAPAWLGASDAMPRPCACYDMWRLIFCSAPLCSPTVIRGLRNHPFIHLRAHSSL